MAVRTETEGESVQGDMERAEKQPDEILASGLVPGSMRKARRGSWLGDCGSSSVGVLYRWFS